MTKANCKKDRKKYRNVLSHPNGLNGKEWPTAIEHNVAYLDEVGAGAWMGPLSIGGVIILPGFNLDGVHDSKLLKPHERDVIYKQAQNCPHIVYHVEHITNDELDELGGLGNAWHVGMSRCVDNLMKKHPIDKIIVDGNKSFEHKIPMEYIIGADSIHVGVALASIMAKVERDNYMESIAHKYPEFEKIIKNGKGYRYGPVHEDLIKQKIYTDLHRKTYAPLKHILRGKFVTKRMLEESKDLI
jgi:ribonuclease HII